MFDFGKYPVIQQHLRHLAAFGLLEESDIRELIEAVGEALAQLEKLEAFKAEVTMNGVYLTEPDFRCRS